MATLAKSKENVLEIGAVNTAQNCQKEIFENIVYYGDGAVQGRKIPESSSAEKALRTECHCKGQRSDWGKASRVSAVACALFQMKLQLLPIRKKPRTYSDTGEGT